MTLAFLFHWDYWQVQALPGDYIEELFARKLAEIEMTQAAAKKRAEANREASTIAQLRAANAASLRMLDLGK